MTSEKVCLRCRKKTSENILFYNLDTPDLIGNKYTQSVGPIRWTGRGVLARGTGALSRPLEIVPHPTFVFLPELKPESALELTEKESSS